MCKLLVRVNSSWHVVCVIDHNIEVIILLCCYSSNTSSNSSDQISDTHTRLSQPTDEKAYHKFFLQSSHKGCLEFHISFTDLRNMEPGRKIRNNSSNTATINLVSKANRLHIFSVKNYFSFVLWEFWRVGGNKRRYISVQNIITIILCLREKNENYCLHPYQTAAFNGIFWIRKRHQSQRRWSNITF